MVARFSSAVNRGIVVVVPKLSHDFITVIVVTSATPRSAMACAISASSSNPCSMESTPACAHTRDPDSRLEWAVTFAPRAWTAWTTRATSSAVQGAVCGSGPSR
jgi:hypothetical protein